MKIIEAKVSGVGRRVNPAQVAIQIKCVDGMIRAAEGNVPRITDKTIVIPGHGPVGNKSQLIEFRDMLVSVRKKVSALKRKVNPWPRSSPPNPPPITMQNGTASTARISPVSFTRAFD